MRFYTILCDLAGFFRNLALREDRFSLNLAPTQLGKAPLVFDWANTNPQRHGGPKDAQKSFERRSNFVAFERLVKLDYLVQTQLTGEPRTLGDFWGVNC